MPVVALTGLVAGLSLIVAIGAQNAFVLRQGLQRRHVVPVVAICAVSDAVLIVAGVAGLGLVVERLPTALIVVRWAGALFLLGYGMRAGVRAWRGGQHQRADGERRLRRGTAVLTALALTWLNPHVYLDTVLLLGSMAATHGPEGRWWFAGGALAASILWFTGLGFGARLLTPLLRRPRAWQILDGVIAVVMVALAVLLLL